MSTRSAGAGRARTLALASCLAGAVVGLLHLCGCVGPAGSAPPVTAQGRLVIVGGGLTEGNARVWRAIAQGAGADGRVGIVPTASASPEEAVASARRRLAAHVPPDRVLAVDLPRDRPANALDPAVVAQIDASRVLFFTGGDQSRTLAVLRQPADTPAAAATRALLARGGTVSGTSAGAAIMSDPMILRGTSRGSWLAGAAAPTDLAPAAAAASGAGSDDGEDRAPRPVALGPGMGYLGGAIVDQHFFSRGRFGRLARAMVDTGIAVGIGIADDRAVLVEPHAGGAIITGLGDEAAMVLVRVADDGGPSFRVGLLNDGDRWQGGVLTPAPGRPGAVERLSGGVLANMLVADAWSPRRMVDEASALARLAAARRAIDAEMTIAPPERAGGVTLRLRTDARTRIYPPSPASGSGASPSDRPAWTFADMIVTIRPGPAAPPGPAPSPGTPPGPATAAPRR